MNFFEKKLKEKRENATKHPGDKSQFLKKTKMDKMKKPAKNAKLGMF